jgi:hypothetical protein
VRRKEGLELAKHMMAKYYEISPSNTTVIQGLFTDLAKSIRDTTSPTPKPIPDWEFEPFESKTMRNQLWKSVRSSPP